MPSSPTFPVPRILLIYSARPELWYRQIARRMYTLWPLKALATTAFMTLFFWAYFAILRNPQFPVTVMPLTAIDHWIPVTSAAFPVYASLWVYASLPAAFAKDFRPLCQFGAWMAAMCLVCLGLFWFFPTAVPPAGIDWHRYPEMAVIKDVDTGGNACPSLHVASAVFAALWLQQIFAAIAAPKLLRWANWLLCLAILWSTIATRQHVLLDVVAGALVGLLCGRMSLRQALRTAGGRGI